MGELEGVKGAWGYVEGGMGSVSQAIANCAQDHGAEIFCDKVSFLQLLQLSVDITVSTCVRACVCACVCVCVCVCVFQVRLSVWAFF